MSKNLHHHETHAGWLHLHEHHHEVSPKTIRYLIISFIINMLLSVVEIVSGVIAGSVALIGDALHNTGDAFSILIAIIAYKIGHKKADSRYTYGFKRAEVIGGFVNLILLFISGIYLITEGISKLISPEAIDGRIIIWVSVLALIIDGATARLSHRDSAHSSNMKMLFLHNLADALGSLGVIISGLCVLYFGWVFVDGIVALLIAAYMLVQSVAAFPKFVRILMNAVPNHIDLSSVQKAIESVRGIRNVHHIHLWAIDEETVALECHLIADNPQCVQHVRQTLGEQFGIMHCNIQTETEQEKCPACHL